MEYYGETTIETALITNVNLAKWTVDLGTQHSDKRLTDVPWSSPYLHQEAGEGFLLVPEVGAQALLCTPADGELSPFVMGYLPIPRDDSYRSNRIDMVPGDMGMMTRDGNFVILRRGGVVQIGATQIAQRIYIPVANTIRDFAQNYSLTTFGGEMVWETDTQRTEQGNTPTRWRLRAKQYAEDSQGGEEYYPVDLSIGRTLPIGDAKKGQGEQNLNNSGIASVGSPLLELNVALQNEAGFQFALDGKGNFYAKSGGSGRWDFERDLVYNVKGNRTVTVSGTDRVVADKRVEEYGTHNMSAQTSRERLELRKEIDAKQVLLGNLALGTEGVVLGDALINAIRAKSLWAGPYPVILVNPTLLMSAVSGTVKASK